MNKIGWELRKSSPRTKINSHKSFSVARAVRGIASLTHSLTFTASLNEVSTW